jgi:hypothetical protein
MRTMSKNTPTPWPDVTPPDPLGQNFSGAPSWVYFSGAATVAMSFKDYALAQRCVNKHADMLAALERIRARLGAIAVMTVHDNGDHYDFGPCLLAGNSADEECLNVAFDDACAALADAKGDR